MDKRRLALRGYKGGRRILEIGCATGNVSTVFRSLPGIEFVGVDLDKAAIGEANRRFAGQPNFRFLAIDAQHLADEGQRFDHTVLAGVLHHMDDAAAARLITIAAELTAPGGALVTYEPVPPWSEAPWLVRLYGRLERGSWMRPSTHLTSLLTANAHGLTLDFDMEEHIAPSIGGWPQCARFALSVMNRR